MRDYCRMPLVTPCPTPIPVCGTPLLTTDRALPPPRLYFCPLYDLPLAVFFPLFARSQAITLPLHRLAYFYPKAASRFLLLASSHPNSHQLRCAHVWRPCNHGRAFAARPLAPRLKKESKILAVAPSEQGPRAPVRSSSHRESG